MHTILIIEDNENILDNLKECLELEGYIILVANSGKRGVDLLKESIPDLVICDIMMPEMDGYEVLHSLLEAPATYNIPFIFSTSKSQKREKVQAIDLGADNYITKPYDLDILLNMVKDLIISGSKRNNAKLSETNNQ